MSAQFGGDQYIAGQKEPVIDMPTRFVDFMRVLVPMAGDDTTPEGEQVNIYGNHVGSWNFAATAYLNRWKVKIYYEHYFDDHSQMFFQYGRWKDGHIGLEITFPKNRFIDTFVYEGLGKKIKPDLCCMIPFGGNLKSKSVLKIIIIITTSIKDGSIGEWE
jgi:hypothetical protein